METVEVVSGVGVERRLGNATRPGSSCEAIGRKSRRGQRAVRRRGALDIT